MIASTNQDALAYLDTKRKKTVVYSSQLNQGLGKEKERSTDVAVRNVAR